MAGEKFIALEETSQEIKTTVNDVKTNVDGLKNTDVPGIDTLVNAVLERIGQAGDTGDTVMGKLNRPQGGGKGYVAVSDMSLKNTQAVNNIFTIPSPVSGYRRWGFENNGDIYMMGITSNSTYATIKVLKIENYKTNPVVTELISNTEFLFAADSGYLSAYNNSRDAFWILTLDKILLKVSLTDLTVSQLCTLSVSGYPSCLSVNDDGTLCSCITASDYLYVCNTETGAAIKRVSHSYDINNAFWFENGRLMYLDYGSTGLALREFNYNTGKTSTIKTESISISINFVKTTDDCIYFFYGASNTYKLTVFNKKTRKAYSLTSNEAMSITSADSERVDVLKDCENGKIIYTRGSYVYSVNAYISGEICLYLKESDRVYTDGVIRDVNNEYLPNINEVVTIPKDSKYLLHGYSYITVG